MKDRFKQIAAEVAAGICEPAPMSVEAFRNLVEEKHYVPSDDASLFTVMKNRLEDFEHYLLNCEYSIVQTVRKIEDETELRRYISDWLHNMSCNAYFVTQEAVTYNENRTDIRLHSKRIDKYATIELKIDDTKNRWSGEDLKNALHNQLVTKYLNCEQCQVGCLLICMREQRKWRNPCTNKNMTLVQTVSWLQAQADALMAARTELYIVVKGIDYSEGCA